MKHESLSDNTIRTLSKAQTKINLLRRLGCFIQNIAIKHRSSRDGPHNGT